MRRALSVSVLLLSVTLQQACQRDEATAPQAPQPSAQAADASSSTSATTSRIAWDCFQAVCMMNADGSAQMFLTTQRDGEPSWSPDGRQIAFASSRDGNREIYVMTGRSQTRLTNDPADDSHPRWSPDGTRIAFMSRRDGNDEIYVMNADGSALTRLTNNPAVDINPSWSPDGQRIAFTSTRDGDFNEEIYVMAADGSGTTRLTNSPGLDDHPSWSPDGTQIAFMSRRDGNVEIYVMAPDGSNPTRLTNNPAVDFQPTWSPDGQHIAFASNRDGGNWEIYVMAADGSGQTRLTNSARQDWWPSWAPADPPPELILPGDLTVPATRLNGTIVNYTVTVTDPPATCGRSSPRTRARRWPRRRRRRWPAWKVPKRSLPRRRRIVRVRRASFKALLVTSRGPSKGVCSRPIKGTRCWTGSPAPPDSWPRRQSRPRLGVVRPRARSLRPNRPWRMAMPSERRGSSKMPSRIITRRPR